MRRLIRLLPIIGLTLAFSAAWAEQSFINLTTYPNATVSDGHSTATVTATIRTNDGRPVPDGTQVVFSTTLGSFREDVVTTFNGIARAVFVAGNEPGMAKITATAALGDAAPASINFQLVADRALLSAAREYVEIVTTKALMYTPDNGILTASGHGDDQGVSVRYRDIEINADDLQFDVPNYDIRVHKATVKFGKVSHHFEELYLNLATRKGVGIGTYTTRRPNAIVPMGRDGIAFVKVSEDGSYEVAPLQERLGTLNIDNGVVTASNVPIGSDFLEFKELDPSPSSIAAKKAIVFPRKDIQFQRAEVYVQGSKVLKLPLYDLSTQAGNSNIVTGGILSVDDNQIQLNYPQYTALRPGFSSLFRFRTGDQYDASGSSRGLFVDYEMAWNRGDDMDGGLTFSGLARSDWSIGLKQYLKVNDRSTMYAQVELPQAQSFLGSVGGSTQQKGYQLSTNANVSKTFTGIQDTAEDLNFTAEKDPIKVGKLPFNLYYGFTASRTQNSLLAETQQGLGLHIRTQSSAIHVDTKTLLTTSFTVSKMYGQNEISGLALNGEARLDRPVARGAHLGLQYQFTHDGFNDKLIGEHSVGLTGSYLRGNVSFDFNSSRALDIDRNFLQANLSYRVSPLWRLTSTYDSDRYLSDEFLDYGVGFAYRIGAGPLSREVGLVWNYRTQRIGFQFLGANGF